MALPSDHYVLPSNESERERLHLQHHKVLQPLFGGKLIHPNIVLKPGDRILDCGTGSGVWLLDLAQSIPPDVAAYGIDVQPNLFPADPPANVYLSVHSATSLPPAWSGTFVLAHQRLLMGALRRTEWAAALHELHRVPAPGGWVQLLECEAWAAGPAVVRQRVLMGALFDAKGLVFDCCAALPGMLQEAGFVGTHVVRKELALCGEEGADDRRNSVAVFRGMRAPIMELGGLGHVGSEEEFDRLAEEVEREMEVVKESVKYYTVFYAQKPPA